MKTEPTDPMDTIPHYVFWREGCAKIARCACFFIRMAGDPVTPASVRKFLASAPRHAEELGDKDWRRGYCCQVLERSSFVCDGLADHEPWKEAFWYITRDVPSWKWDTAEMLLETVAGALSGLDLDPPSVKPPPSKRPRSFRGLWSAFVNKKVR